VIITCKKQIPFRWIAFAILPWAAFNFYGKVMGTAFVFSFYDPAHPETVVFPWLISTWFVAGVLTLVGLAGTIIGAVLWYWANKPVELPEIAHSAPGKL